MSRSGYREADSCDEYDILRIEGWQANVRRCIRGRGGQAFMWELYLALEALRKRELITGALVDADGDCCALGAVALERGCLVPDELKVINGEEPDDDADFYETTSSLLGIKTLLAREVMFHNDEGDDWHMPDGGIVDGFPWPMRDVPIRRTDTPAERWQRMRMWVVSQLREIP